MKKTYKQISLLILAATFIAGSAFGVSSQITRHSTAADLLEGEVENVIIDSSGTIELARRASDLQLGKTIDEAWTINCITTDSKGNVYAGTSPNGIVIKYSKNKAEVIYEPQVPAKDQKQQSEEDVENKEEGEDKEEDKDADNDADDEPEMINEHIFAVAIDAGGRLLAAVSGENCRLLRFSNGQSEVIYQPEDVMYILSITTDQVGNIFLGTGPDGKVVRLDSFGANPEVIYDSEDSNILSLAIAEDGFVYAGSDERGLVYKIDQGKKTATVLYDTEQKEVTSLMLDEEGNLYATATSSLAASNQSKFTSIASSIKDGKPEAKKEESPKKDSSTTSLRVANSKDIKAKTSSGSSSQIQRGTSTKSASHIYKIDPRGFVTDIFSESAVFFAMAQEDGKLLLATGNNAQLFSIDLETENKTIAYEDQKSAQITALAVTNDKVYLAAANPSKIIELSTDLSKSGVYTSKLVDASQPAQWGKLQLDADLPKGCSITMAARSGNVNEPNDPTFSPWTKDVRISEATQLTCPIGRFCQYRLTLKTNNDSLTPTVRQIAVPHLVPNLAPQVLNVKTTLSKDTQKQGFTKIEYNTVDKNNDKLIFTIELRKLGRQRWIKIKDDHSVNSYEWDTRTVEDGEYEVRVTADDRLSNTPATKLTGTRISDTFIVDNTAPEIASQQITVKGDKATINLTIKDRFTIIGQIKYTINSDEKWTSMIPDDMVYDTTSEDFTIVAEDLEPGEHIVAVRIADDIGNVTYKTFEVKVK